MPDDYQEKVIEKIKLFEDIFKKDENGDSKTLLKNVKDIKDKSSIQNAKNDYTKIAFMERYLFLIVKILFFSILILYFLYRIRGSLVFRLNTRPVLDSLYSLRKKRDDNSKK